jgi:2-polyprenyl-3-methyl-5-hydroxy-6-metoxy-1,4-benzoquinol methylase
MTALNTMESSAMESSAAERDAFVERLFGATLGALDVVTVYVGDRLGFYRALVAAGSANSAGLAEATGCNERYVREWLEQQAATGILTVDDASAGAGERRYMLPAGYDEVLIDERNLNYMAALVRLVVGCFRPLPELLKVFRTGGGIPYVDYEADVREGIAEMNRPMFLNLLGSEWLPAVPDVHARLQDAPAARVADVGCGVGWSSIAIAQAYPLAQVEGFDLDDASIEQARKNAVAAGVAGRVSFHVHDAADPALVGRYDLVTAFETIHDMSRPVEALRNMRGLTRQGGAVIIADERVEEAFAAPGTDIERLNYGFSVLHCLPSCMAEQPSAATGTVMRPDTLRGYAVEAGFDDVEILPIENGFWRFYRLT